MEKQEPQQPFQSGIRPKATVEFTLHVKCADGTTKDIKCIGTVKTDTERDQG